MKKLVMSLFTTMLTVSLVAPAATAGERRDRSSVTACSKSGNQACYTAAVGEGRYGPKLRLKHGTWIDCDGDCRETLRRTTVDYWDDRRENY